MKRNYLTCLVIGLLLVLFCFPLVTDASETSQTDDLLFEKIKEDYLAYISENPDLIYENDMTVDDIKIDHYYNRHNGYDIVQMWYVDYSYDFGLKTIDLGDYEFLTNHCNFEYFFAYNDGNFIHIRDAYASGLLTDKDIYLISKEAEKNVVSWNNPFVDVDMDDWHYESVECVYGYDLFSGLTENTFGPDVEMTRAMTVTILWRMAGSPTGYQNTFEDVLEDKWYTDAVAWATSKGIVYGVTESSFAPDAFVTREQITAMIYRYAKHLNMGHTDLTDDINNHKYIDQNEIGSWAHESMSWAHANKLIYGRQMGDMLYIAPQGNATRAEFAAIITRFIDLCDM